MYMPGDLHKDDMTNTFKSNKITGSNYVTSNHW